jgi:DNA segregation ATPase FtsK/SpoIIIE, S-DNA-T family
VGANAAPRPAGRGRQVGAELAERHAVDAWGLALLATALLVALGVYLDLAGPLGRAIDLGAGWCVGIGRFVVPPVLALLAVVLLREGRGSGFPRVVIGLVVTGVAALALAHLTRGRPSVGASGDDLGHAGGIAGAVLGQPLHSVAGTWGAGVVLAAVLVLGLLVTTGTSLRQAGHLVAVALGLLARSFRLAWSKVDDGIAEPEVVDLTGPVPVVRGGRRRRPAGVYDQGGDGDDGLDTVPPATPEAPRRRPRVADFALDGDGDDDAAEIGPDDAVAEPVEGALPPARAPRARKPAGTDDAGAARPAADGGAATEQLQIPLGPAAAVGPWKLPAPTLLEAGALKPVDRKVIEEGGVILEATLAQFGVDANLVGMTVGPTITRYELELGEGVKVARITSLSNDIAYAMASPDVRIIAPIPGRKAIGVEVPNRQRQVVTLGGVLTSPEAAAARHPLEIALGRDIAGRPVLVNLATMPHVLIAGATGSGKSSCINAILTSLLVRTTPEQVRLILVDPKRVELTAYADVPHLLTRVVTDPKKAANALDWAVKEMERRYDLLHEVGHRDITGYNAAYDRGELVNEHGPSRGPIAQALAESDPDEELEEEGSHYARLPFIVVVVDELNDLMMVAAKDVENSICRIAQMARAVGIHLVIATQRPSVNVITGVIKANVPSRMAFSVSSLADSRVILDSAGAEKLIGKGDLLMVTASSGRSQRIQCAWVDEADVRKVVAHWRRQVTEPTFVDGVQDGDPDARAIGTSGGDDDDDDLLSEAMELVVRSGLGSTSMLQRKLRVGFSRAGRLMDLLERRGVVGPSEGSKARTVLMTVDELEEMRERA